MENSIMQDWNMHSEIPNIQPRRLQFQMISSSIRLCESKS